MADTMTIDIALLKGVFGDLQRVQQQLSGISGGVAVLDQSVAAHTAGVNKSFQSVNRVLGSVETTADGVMRNVVQDLLDPIAKTRELQGKLDDLNTKMRQSRSISEIAKLKTEIRGVQGELDKVNASGAEQRIAGPLGRVRGLLGGLAAPLAGAFAIGAVTAFGSSVVQATANQEMYRNSLQVMLQDKAKVDALMADVKRFAAETPFELTEVQAASKMFATQFASTDILPRLKTIGQTAAALGQPFNEIASFYLKVKSGGLVQAEELNQMGDRGIPLIKELAAVMGVADTKVRELASKGKVGFKEMEAAFERMGGAGGRFDGIFSAAMNSLTGQMSLVADDWGQFKVELGESLAPYIRSGIGVLGDALGGLRSTFTWIRENGDAIMTVVKGVAIATGIYTTALLINNRQLIMNQALQLATNAVMAVKAVVTNVVTAATTLWEVAQWAINAALTANPIGVIIMAIAALVAAVIWLVNHWDAATAYLEGMWESWKIGFQGFVDVVRIVFGAVADIVEGTWLVIKSQFMTGEEAMRTRIQGVLQLRKGVHDATQGVAESIVSTAVKQKQVELNALAKAVAIDAVQQAKEKTAEAQKHGGGMSAVAPPPGTIDATKLQPGSVGAAQLVGGGSSGSTGNAGGVTVGGGKEGDRNISVNMTVNMPMRIDRDVDRSIEDIEEALLNRLASGLRDFEYALS